MARIARGHAGRTPARRIHDRPDPLTIRLLRVGYAIHRRAQTDRRPGDVLLSAVMDLGLGLAAMLDRPAAGDAAQDFSAYVQHAEPGDPYTSICVRFKDPRALSRRSSPTVREVAKRAAEAHAAALRTDEERFEAHRAARREADRRRRAVKAA